MPRMLVLMGVYLGLIGREGNEVELAHLVDVVGDRLQQGGLGLAVGSEHAGDAQNYSAHENEARRMGNEEPR